MRKLLILLFICLGTTPLFAQDVDNVFYKLPTAADSINNDSIPAFTQYCFGFYFMPGLSFNNGTAVAPPQDLNQISAGISNLSDYYVSAPEKAAFCFSFGLFYESKPFAKRLFYSIGLELLSTKYTGTATFITTSFSTTYNTNQNIPYSWSTYSANIPLGMHLIIARSKRCRLDLGIAASPGFFILQSNSGDKAQPNFDTFHNFTTWGIGNLGFEYFAGGSFIFRAEPCYTYNLFHSDHNRRLNVLGLKIGVIVK